MAGSENSKAIVFGLSGWLGDRSGGAMEGAAALANSASRIFKGDPVQLGRPEAPGSLPWRAALDRAMPYLLEVRETVSTAFRDGRRPLIFANRCAAGLATLPAVMTSAPDAAVLWFDAHGDFNTPESSSTGYLGGMPLAAMCGFWDAGIGPCLTPDRVALVGARDLDPAEKRLIEENHVRVIPPVDGRIDLDAVLAHVAKRPVWIHIDLDVLEPDCLPTEYQVAGGITPDTLRDVLAALAGRNRILGLEVAEFDLVPERFDADFATILDMIAPITAELFGCTAVR